MTPYSSVKAVWRARGYVLNGYVSMPSPAACELYAIQGWDSVTLDMEHGSIGFDVAVEMPELGISSIPQPVAAVSEGASFTVPDISVPCVSGVSFGLLCSNLVGLRVT